MTSGSAKRDLLRRYTTQPDGWYRWYRRGARGACDGAAVPHLESTQWRQRSDVTHALGRVHRRRPRRRHRVGAPVRRRRRPVAPARQPAGLDSTPVADRRRPPSAAAGSTTAPARRTRRGADEFVAVSWDELTELLADELRRIVDTHGNEAIYGGSYGWASAGRFHHAQSQVHRFLKLLGGYTFSRHSYSLGATGVIMPRVVGTHDDLFKRSTDWDVIADHTDLMVCFGGVGAEELRRQPRRHHRTSDPRRAAAAPRARRTDRVVQPAARRRRRRLRVVGARCPAPTSRSCWRWRTCWPPRAWPTAPSSTRYCTGYPRFERYLLGADDGVAKSPRVGGGDQRAARRRPGRAGPADGRRRARW